MSSKISSSDMNDQDTWPNSDTLEDKIKLLLISISAEEAKLAREIQAFTEKIQSISHLLNEQCETDPSPIIDNLIQQNLNIEQELKESIKKEMDFQLELEKLLVSTPNS